ncbi:MAG: riboflavin synthase [Sedimentisphaerales bacterium]|nr:riboflavin synthase [Sedimentisphaerales bacterium]
MFTGIIEAVCAVKSIRYSGGGAVLTVDFGEMGRDCKIGNSSRRRLAEPERDSIAINGVCLTVADFTDGHATFEISTETLRISTLGRLKAGSIVNVERAMKAADRFGGHFVQGHIDGTATIKEINRSGQFTDIEFTAGPELLDQMVVKGSIAVDGISLTIANMDDRSFSVALIPETLKGTTLGVAKAGDVVNIETDIIVKTIKKQLDKIVPHQQSLTVERLRELGF